MLTSTVVLINVLLHRIIAKAQEDVHGKIITNLYKIVKEKSEKIKLLEKVIESLNERLQNKGTNDSIFQVGSTTNIVGGNENDNGKVI